MDLKRCMVNAQGLLKHVLKYVWPGRYGTRDTCANVLGRILSACHDTTASSETQTAIDTANHRYAPTAKQNKCKAWMRCIA